MRLSPPPLRRLAASNAAIMYPTKHPRGRGRQSYNRHYSGAGRQQQPQFVTGDDHFHTVHDVNSSFRRDDRGSFSNQRNSPFNPLFRRHPPPPPFNRAQNVRPRPPDYRVWEYSSEPPPPRHFGRFKILSYNILADYLALGHRGKLYYHIPGWMLDWQWRKQSIVFELGLWSADIMCLQEVDKFGDLEEELKLKGYSGIWKMRTGNAVDGCAIFWRTSRFNLRYEECIEFNKFGLRDNVAQICVLELVNQVGVPLSSLIGFNKVVICNIHVFYNPKRGEIKLGQVRVLLDRAKAISKLWDDAPVVICGDFNCTPKSPLYNFISEQKLNLSGIDRDKVSGQASAEIRKPRLYAPNFSERSANISVPDTSTVDNKEVNVEPNICSSYIQKSDNQGNTVDSQYNQVALDMSTKSSTGVQSENRSNVSYNAEVFIQHTAVDNDMTINEVDGINEESIPSFNEEQIPDAISSNPESSSEKFSLDFSNGSNYAECGNCSTSLGEDNQSVRVKLNSESSELPSAEMSSTNSSVQMSFSDSIETSQLTYEEGPSFELTSDVQMRSTLTSWQSSNNDFLLDEKLEKLSLNEMDKDMLGGENSGEDIDAFTSALHNTQEGFLPSFGADLEKSESRTYKPSLWTPSEIETATGNSDCTFLEHSLPLRSTYIEVKHCPGTRDPNGEPLATSYHRCFLGTVDYIWRSDGLQTIRVLAPIPKHAMEEFTSGFPTKKWGSDHIALVSELAIVKGGVTNVSGGVR